MSILYGYLKCRVGIYIYIWLNISVICILFMGKNKCELLIISWWLK